MRNKYLVTIGFLLTIAVSTLLPYVVIAGLGVTTPVIVAGLTLLSLAGWTGAFALLVVAEMKGN